MCYLLSLQSSAQRLKVGCLIVKNGRIVSSGYNGMLPGDTNICEQNGITKPSLIHAELNAILNCAKNGISIKDCDLYVTDSPCINCSKCIIQTGIKSVHYFRKYRDISGILLLNEFGIKTYQHEIIDIL